MRLRSDEYKEWAKVHAAKKRKENPDVHRQRVRASRLKRIAADPLFYKRADLMRCYGVTLEWYETQLNKQNHRCAICGKHESENTIRDNRPLRLSVDHCHSTDRVRGLLCNNCNRAIGLLNHCDTTIEAALSYLKADRGLN